MRTRYIVLFTLGSLALVGATFLTLSFYDIWPGGFPSNYHAVNEDFWLTRVARSAMPIVTEADKYHTRNGTYPEGYGAFLAGPYGDIHPGEPYMNWYYLSRPNGFVLMRKIGINSSLQCCRTGLTTQWYFDPGDGSPRVAIKLNP